MVAQQLVLNYCRKARHFESLYFASVANNILWWTFVKACFNVVWGLIGGVCHPACKTSHPEQPTCTFPLCCWAVRSHADCTQAYLANLPTKTTKWELL